MIQHAIVIKMDSPDTLPDGLNQEVITFTKPLSIAKDSTGNAVRHSRSDSAIVRHLCPRPTAWRSLRRPPHRSSPATALAPSALPLPSLPRRQCMIIRPETGTPCFRFLLCEVVTVSILDRLLPRVLLVRPSKPDRELREAGVQRLRTRASPAVGRRHHQGLCVSCGSPPHPPSPAGIPPNRGSGRGQR